MKENSLNKKREYRLIDGGPLCTVERRVGYCWYVLHPGFLTKKLMDQHECLEKKCPYFERFKDSPYWVYKSKMKENRINNKRKSKALLSKQQAIFARLCKLTAHIENFAVADVEMKDGIFYIRCVSLAPVDLKPFIRRVSVEFKSRVRFYFVQNTYAARKELLEKLKNELN